MIRDYQYRLSEQDVNRILKLIGHLKEAIGALMYNRQNMLPSEEFDDIPTASELMFSERAYNILSNRIP